MKEVLFVCEHGSAKSVVAATLYRRMALQSGRPAAVSARGKDPDEQIPEHVRDGLAARGLRPVDPRPVALTETDLARAELVVTFGVEIENLRDGATHLRWDDVPPVSADFAAAFESIQTRIATLLADGYED